MNEVVTPLYLSFACLFLGLTLAAMPNRDRRLQPAERMGAYGMAGSVAAALACICIAFVPYFGRPLLTLSTVFLWAAFLATCLRARSWHTSIGTAGVSRGLLLLLLAVGLLVLQIAMAWPRAVRICFQLLVSIGFLAWLGLELVRVWRKVASAQLTLMLISVVAMALVLFLWSWILLSDHAWQMLSFSKLFSEASMAFAMRLFVVSVLALILISANGYGLERMVQLKSSISSEKAQSDQLNQQLQQLLQEKNEMLQSLSFAVRSQNLPVIMSSLSHELNQPLGAIRLNTDYMLAEGERLTPDERSQLLKQLVIGSMAATQVVRDFRRFLEVAPKPHEVVHLSALIGDLLRALQTEFTRQEIKVSMSADNRTQVLGDPVQLESAITAALQHMLAREAQPGRRMQIRLRCIKRFVEILVLLDGTAWSRTEFDQAFVRPLHGIPDHFSQQLWLCRAILEHHSGSIEIHQEPGCSGLRLQLPLLETPHDPAQ